uniref:Uncharacterized protein n=1 Tax=Pipistrellus kuhlii TaxID=59472 RepID=A0A7J7RGY7_PIPKU|nr:hypothetical protein mPipKuh1_010543 [Pipistrellus kuhlii]
MNQEVTVDSRSGHRPGFQAPCSMGRGRCRRQQMDVSLSLPLSEIHEDIKIYIYIYRPVGCGPTSVNRNSCTSPSPPSPRPPPSLLAKAGLLRTQEGGDPEEGAVHRPDESLRRGRVHTPHRPSQALTSPVKPKPARSASWKDAHAGSWAVVWAPLHGLALSPLPLRLGRLQPGSRAATGMP